MLDLQTKIYRMTLNLRTAFIVVIAPHGLTWPLRRFSSSRLVAKSISSGINPLLLAFLAIGCGIQNREPVSQTKQAPDRENHIELSGYRESLDYDAVKMNEKVSTKDVPWADTYWPFVEKGLSRRWNDIPLEGGETSANQTIELAAFLQTHLQQSKADHPDINLSPAEKYDLLYRWRHRVKVDEAKWQSIAKSIGEKEEQLSSLENLSDKREVFSRIHQEFAGGVSSKWLPLSRKGWEQWTSYNANPYYKFLNEEESGEAWGWMGICHGWAPAAILAASPKHSVKVKFGEQSVFFTEGDIRGLLSHSWASYAPYQQQFFIGRRCNADVSDPASIGPLDPQGRNTYGSYKVEENGADLSFSLRREIMADWIKAPFGRARIYYVQMHQETRERRYLFELNYTSQGQRRQYFAFAPSLSVLKRFMESRFQNTEELDTKIFSLTINGCGDVNAAALHATILQRLKKERLGFVIDRTQSGQVWNQPVHSAFVKTGPLVSIDDLRPSVGMNLRFAPSTRFVAEASTTLRWGYEPGRPQWNYSPEFDRIHSRGATTLDYVLEFDQDKKLVGGEWGTFRQPSSGDHIPDFIYGFERDAKPYDDPSSGFDYSGIIDVIHQCSLKPEASGIETISGTSLSFVDCEIHRRRN